MTTIESYYLAICIAAFFGFAIALAVNVWSWKSWKQSVTSVAEKPATAAITPQKKLAA